VGPLGDTSLDMAKKPAIIICFLGAMLCVGCVSSVAPRITLGNATPAPARYAPAPVMQYHFPGIGGHLIFDDWWCDALRQGMTQRGTGPCTTEVVDWFGGRSQIEALQAIGANRVTAKKIAGQIAERAALHPDERIILTAQSGGCALAVWAMEDLPASVRVDSLVMISPSISPEYDLSRALAHLTQTHLSGRAFVFTDESDWLILGWGTQTFGTSDGRHCEAAGRCGFVQPSSADPQQYSKLQTLPYRTDWLRYGNIGGHATAMSPFFGQDVIAPLVVGEAAVDE
jgi:pimeloyl-ACP methyl ester carboxylesterase